MNERPKSLFVKLTEVQKTGQPCTIILKDGSELTCQKIKNVKCGLTTSVTDSILVQTNEGDVTLTNVVDVR